MVGGPTELASVVERIHAECANVVPFHWFQLEMLAGDDGEARSWRAGADGPLDEGTAEPERHPPMLPGIHRRSEWRLVERLLAGPDGAVARLTLWCDPRRLETPDLTLFEALLPQMATSIRQALLDREAREDRLTGTAVRRVLEKRLFDAFRRAVDDGRSLAVVMVDVDRFKRINDRHGHAAGDRALAAVAAVLTQHKRQQDLLARYGGEEFTLLVEDADGAAALAIAERLRRAVEEIDFEVDGTTLALTVSAGVAAFPELHVKTPSELLLLADGALYEAKNRGRNRCLLDLGRARYRGPDGEAVTSEEASAEPPPPRIFA
jgi:diguanylate cyclase (GGDEF)-like protein